MGADLDKFITVKDNDPITTIDDPRFEDIIAEERPRAVILDPVQSFMGPNASLSRVEIVRPFMTKLKDIAEKYKCAVILVAHMPKSRAKGTANPLGSIDFKAAARTVLRVGANPNDPDERAITITDTNLTEAHQSFGYKIANGGNFLWLGPSELTAADMDVTPKKVKADKPPRPRDKVIDAIKRLLADGPVATKELEQKVMAATGVSISTIDRARQELHIIPEQKTEFQGKTYLRLPAPEKYEEFLKEQANKAQEAE